MRVVVNALLACMPSFVNIAVVSVLFYLVFAVLAVQFWAGKFWSCQTTNADGEELFKRCLTAVLTLF